MAIQDRARGANRLHKVAESWASGPASAARYAAWRRAAARTWSTHPATQCHRDQASLARRAADISRVAAGLRAYVAAADSAIAAIFAATRDDT